MMVSVIANDNQWQELFDSGVQNIIRSNSIHDIANALLLLNNAIPIGELSKTNKPIIYNSVINTLAELKAPDNIVRINGWQSFLKRKTWEVAGILTPDLKEVFSFLSIKYINVADASGLIAARPIAMIINEAYFALSENISTKQEIDIAMKLGTNYPYGPFEWCEIIGVKKIYQLLLKLSKEDSRYLPASLLIEEALK